MYVYAKFALTYPDPVVPYIFEKLCIPDVIIILVELTPVSISYNE